MRIAILGNGGFGTAMALTLERAGHDVSLWGHNPEYTAEIAATRQNPRYLAGVSLPASIRVGDDAGAALDGAGAVLVAVPTQHVRGVLTEMRGLLTGDAPVVSLAKGLEQSTGHRPSEILAEVLGSPERVYVLSGPSHAEEIAHGQPTTVVVAGDDSERLRGLQAALQTDRFRVYRNADLLGVELCGALKNVVALGAGFCDGLGYGGNTKAAIIRIGLKEMIKFCKTFYNGIDDDTFLESCGVADLITTCFGGRNRKCAEAFAAAGKQKAELQKQLPRTLMTVSVKPRPIRILPRGNWMDDSGPVVTPGVPGFLPALEVGDRRANRLDLARWIVRKDNPLTARAFVNRLWKLYFGRGLTAPLDDLGAQGTRPVHPELLDWLAVEFIESGWNVKHMVRLIVNSGAYRQNSLVGASLRERDPYNQLLARQSRFRLDAEIVRDNALAVSGLLVTRVGGPSVKPYQPAGYWRHMNFPARTWKSSAGKSVYRRGLYTWWQRMFLHPSLLAFDAPSREECTVERPRSNTPQQALVLLNDPTYVEAAAALAERIIDSKSDGFSGRLAWAFRRVLSRQPRPEEARVLKSVFDRHLADYKADPASAGRALSAGRLKPPQKATAEAVAERAAWMSLARILLNLHETINRS